MRHWLGLADQNPEHLARLIAMARSIKSGSLFADALRDKILTMVFFNSSLRTRTSFEAGLARFGGRAICLNVGADTWQLEHRKGVTMDGQASEHIQEAAAVLGRYGHALAVRSFAQLKDAQADARDEILNGFAEYAGVPVINMEAAQEHPCQGLADWMTMSELLGETSGRRFVLSWAPHIKPLPRAVPHSALLAAAAAGMHVTVTHPSGYELHPEIVAQARAWTTAHGTEFAVTERQREATTEADVVYVKSWGAAPLYHDRAAQVASFEVHRDWQITPAHIRDDTHVLHCLPVRRNIVIQDAVLDAQHKTVVQQAENRMWAQAAIMQDLFSSEDE